MHASLFVAFTLLGSSIAAAQTPAASQGTAPRSGLVWSVDFAQRVTGRHLIITTIDGRQYEGTINVTSTGLETSGRSAVSVPFDHVSRLEKPTYRMRQGAWIGAAAGAATGMIAACFSDDYCQEEPEWIFAMGALWGGIGAGVGAGIGAALNHAHRNADIVWDSYRRTTTVAVAPMLSPTRKGVMVRVAWR
jgi:hypothetical protein